MRRSFISLLCSVAVAAASLFAVASPAAAEPGDLDGAYGTCGFILARNPDRISLLASDRAKDLELTSGAPSVTGTNVRFTRRLPDGRLDPSFGTRGRTTVSIPGWVDSERLVQLTVDHSHRVLASITAEISSTEADTRGFVVRLDSSGLPDANFGGGVVRTELQSVEFVVGPGNDLYGTGGASPTDPVSASIHISDSGIVDASFDLAALPGATGLRHVQVMAIQPDGKLLGIDRTEGAPGVFGAVLRWSLDGSLDPSFAGIRPPTLPGQSAAIADVVPGTDGTVVVLYRLSSTRPKSPKALVARYTNDGTPDTSFGLLGAIVVPASTPAHALSVDETGRITIASSVLVGTELNPRIVRLLPNGAFDGQFGANGVSTFNTIGLWSTARGTEAWELATVLTLPSSTEFPRVAHATARVAMTPLKPGAGLTLQWNGDAWPTRFGSNPGPECPYDTPYWPNDDNARGITTVRGKGGYVVDLFGGIHPFSIGLQHAKPAPAVGGPYWAGWDIARGVAAKRNGTGGYVLDGFGGLHPFHTGANPQPASIIGGPYWLGWNIARGVALMPDGYRGYILDGFGGLHRFTTPGHPLPPAVTGNAYWPGWDIARGVGILGDGTGGYIVDAYGGTHPFGIGTHAAPPGPGPGAPYAAGVDWVRGYTFIDPKPVTAPAAAASTGVPTTDSVGALLANAQRRGPTPVGPASP